MTPEQVIRTRGERKRRWVWTAGMGSAVAVLALFLLGTCAMAANASIQPLIAVNTHIAGIDVGGLTRQEASERIAASLAWADRRITLMWAKGGVTVSDAFSMESLGLTADVEGTLKGVPTTFFWGRSSAREDVPLCVTLNEGELDKVLSRLRPLVDMKPSDARILITQDDEVQIVEGTAGNRLNTTRLKEMLVGTGRWNSIPSIIELPVDAVGPDTIGDDLRAMGIDGMISSYSTAVNKDNDRTENIRLAAKRLDCHLLPPGEEFSFNGVIGPRTAEDGYRETPVYWRDEVRKGFGGGVCQLSTTLYNAALLADLEILERHPHSLTVDYVPLGRDAAVSYGEVDLRFCNNTSNHVLIRAHVADGRVHVKMFGDAGADRKVVINAHVLKRTDFVTETIEDPSLAEGQIQVTNGKPGYVVRSERVVYLGAQQVKKEDLGISSYYPLKKQVRLGPGAVPPGQAQVAPVDPPASPGQAQYPPDQVPALAQTRPPGV